MNHEEESEISVLLADDHPGIISGIRHELASEQDILLNASVSNSSDLIRRLEEEDFDVLVSDYSMPKGGYGDGLQLFSYISRKFPQVGLVVLTMLDNPAILQALTQVSGISIVSKADPVLHLVPAIHAAYAGGIYYSPSISECLGRVGANGIPIEGKSPVILSPKEAEVVRLYAAGLRVDEIAARLNRSKKTISTQKVKAMHKLGIKKDIDLMKYALECGWVTSSRGV
ncbi:Capsular synthesis regulator component B [Delftia tsuruhatensis]|uniref:response regulator n=1 Tax=Delftia tsuruhatensis TaxID=180282 RepID=UPI001E7B57AB|nr:response regulator [Delftia tsuruhatensis]CAB5717133.1 Capsular synthesis regulator component B [Delftia tsuruhatensis]CAC9684033.1 Capsular synthesis regulator component B [Delftia tsuruhatensis]